LTACPAGLIPLGVAEALADYAQAFLAQVEHDTIGQVGLATHVQGVIATVGTQRAQVGNEIGGGQLDGPGYSRAALTE
jgi:hypothetical protein